jgi:hypothetical protein
LKIQTNAPRLLRAALFTLLLTAFAGAGHEAFGQATTTTTNENIQFTGSYFNPCTGEQVTFSGTMQVTNHMTTDASGGTHLRTHTNYQNVTGTGVLSGSTYRVGTVSNEVVNDNDGPQLNATVISTVKLIGPGSTLNYFLRIVMHITINANGETTSNVQEVVIECRGQN